MPKQKLYQFSLALDEGDEDESGAQPRRLLRLPSGHLLAYGGENGNVSCLMEQDDSMSNKFVIVQRYDDEVRALAVSPNGRRIAVGFDDGSTQIYKFDDYDVKSTALHPFVQALDKAGKFGDETSGNDGLLSQDFLGGDACNDYFAGPRFESPIRDLQFIPLVQEESYLLAIASESGICLVAVTSLEETMESPRHLEQEAKEHHDHCGIRGIAVNDAADVMATLGMDGRLCLWNLDQINLLVREDSLCIPKKDVGEILGADPYDRSCRPLIHKDTVIATPGRLTPFVRLLDRNAIGGRDDPQKMLQNIDATSFEGAADDGHMEPIITITYCNDNCLATSGRDAQIILWQSPDEESNGNDPLATKKWKIVSKHMLQSPATDLCFYKNRIFAACANGSCAVLDVTRNLEKPRNKERVFSKQLGSPSPLEQVANPTPEKSKSKSRTSKVSPTTKHALQKRDFDDDEDDDIDFTNATNDSSEPKPANSRVRFVDDEADEDDDDKLEFAGQSGGGAPGSSLDGDEDRDGRRFASCATEHDDDSFDEGLTNQLIPAMNMMKAVKPQPAFSPSSTPLDLTRRYLCWNHVGSVTILHGEDQRNTVDINFTDSAFKRPISFTDNINFILGSLGEEGGIFASDLQDDDDDDDGDREDLEGLNMSEEIKQAVRRDRKKNSKAESNAKPMGSSIFFYRFETFGSLRNKDWYLTLPDGERVLGASCGEGWAAAMTSRRFLRLFSSGGNQAQVVWLKGEPVTMVGRGRFLAVIYHHSAPQTDATQQLGYTLWDASSFRVISQGPVACLSKASSLSWVGFSNDLSLLVMDSDGMLSMLVPTTEQKPELRVFVWVPVLDTVGLRKSADDLYWPVTVFDGKLVCVPLKGGNTYPDATRRPVTTTLGLRMPLAKSVVARNSTLEELSVRSNLALAQKTFLIDMEENADHEDLEKEYLTLSAQVDKVTLKLFAATVDEGKLEAALDLVDRLHLEKSYDLAIRLADRHDKLADMIEDAKERKFSVLEGDHVTYDVYEKDEQGDSHGFKETPYMNRMESSLQQITPELSHRVEQNTKGRHQTSQIPKRQRLH